MAELGALGRVDAVEADAGVGDVDGVPIDHRGPAGDGLGRRQG